MSANGLHRMRWRRVAVARIHRTAVSQFARDLEHIQQSIYCLPSLSTVERLTGSPRLFGALRKFFTLTPFYRFNIVFTNKFQSSWLCYSQDRH